MSCGWIFAYIIVLVDIYCYHLDEPILWKVEHFIYQSRKIRSIYTFCWNRGLIIYLAALKKGAIRHAHPYYAIYPSPPQPRPPGESSLGAMSRGTFSDVAAHKMFPVFHFYPASTQRWNNVDSTSRLNQRSCIKSYPSKHTTLKQRQFDGWFNVFTLNQRSIDRRWFNVVC